MEAVQSAAPAPDQDAGFCCQPGAAPHDYLAPSAAQHGHKWLRVWACQRWSAKTVPAQWTNKSLCSEHSASKTSHP